MTTLAQLLSEYVRQNPRSGQLFQRAQAALPGGNTRTGVYVDPFPLYMRSGDQAKRFLALRKLSVERAQAAER